ncbi:MAG: alpha/beta hydrolase [Chloroflexi bacterium]|nr:alpha/beta hydrolase [Chloroflexota bacterium]
MTVHAVRVPCDEITLEGRLHLPEAAPHAGVVLCHPHPLYGGSMDNNVVLALTEALTARGMAALRFNFRGVGRSGGQFGGGIVEREDVRAVLTFLTSSDLGQVPVLGLAGYSFGGGVALGVAGTWPGLAALALIAPAAAPEPVALGDLTMPKLVMVGEEDSFVTPERLRRLATSLPPPLQVETFPGVDHFWWGAEVEMAERVGRFFVAAMSD